LKIYTKVVWDYSGNVIEEQSYEYDGPIAEAKGTVNIPGPTSEERALQATQTRLLEQQASAFTEQQRIQNLLSPFIFESTGVKPIFDPNDPSRIISFEPITDELKPLRSQIEKGFLERTQAALAGQLPVNPALLSDLAENERTLRETLRRQLGPGFETSSPGIESLGEFGQRRSELLESARRGDLSLAEQLGISRQQANDLQLQNLLRNITGASNFPFQAAPGFGQAAAGFGAAQQPFQFQRGLQTQANIAGAQASSGLFGDIFGGIGSILGLGLSGMGGFGGLFGGGGGGGGGLSGTAFMGGGANPRGF